MINLLPIKLISEIDQPMFGANLFHLGLLYRDGFPIPTSVAISQPEFILNTVLKQLKDQDVQVFEQSLVVVKNDLLKISPPEEFIKLAKENKGRIFYLRGEIFKDAKSLWKACLSFWMSEIEFKIIRGGFTNGLTFGLSPLAIFFIPKGFFSQAKAYYDPDLVEVVIKSPGKINPLFLKKIDEIVLLGNKKIFLPQIYEFLIFKDGLFIVGTSPFTQTLPLSKEEDIVINKNEEKKLIKSSVKIFLNISSGFAIEKHIDGILVEGEKVSSYDGQSIDIETTSFKLAEAALSFPTQPVIYKLPDIKTDNIRGALRLFNQQSLLEKAVEILHFVREKKNLWNIEVAIPYVLSVEELTQLKKELEARGVSGKESIHFWLEAAVPENIINISDYLKEGIDGLILNLDSLQKLICGYDFGAEEFYKKQAQTLLKFIQPIFKILHQDKIPILAKGELVLHSEVLDFLVENGVWGVVGNSPLEVDSLPEHLNWVERRMVEKRLG